MGTVGHHGAGRLARATLGHSSFYEVQADDTIDAIARRFGVSVERLIAANDGIARGGLAAGRVLQVNGL